MVLDSRGIQLIFDMLSRVEANLHFLAPCNDASRTAKSKSTDVYQLEKGRFYSFAGTEFDEYYSNLLQLLVKSLIDEQFIDVSTPSSDAAKSLQIKNFQILPLIQKLLETSHSSLVIIGVRVAFITIKLNTSNSITLEHFHVLSAIFKCMTRLVMKGRLDLSIKSPVLSGSNSKESFHEDSANYQTLPAKAAKPTADVTTRSTSQNILDLCIPDFLDELAEVIQLFAIYFSKRDDNLLKYFGLFNGFFMDANEF